MVVNVEQGAANRVWASWLRISDALGIGLPALVEPPQPKPVKVTRQGAGATLWSSECGGRGVLVAGTRAPNVVELWDWTLCPGDLHKSEGHTPGTADLLHVHEGTVTIAVADQTVDPKMGDAVAFPGDMSHSYANLGTKPARFSLTVFEPGWERGPHRRR